MPRQTANEAFLYEVRRPSATASLRSTLDKDVELSLDKTSKHVNWSVSGLARSVLLRAKGSIDHIRGVPEQDVQSHPVLPARASSSARARLTGASDFNGATEPDVRRGASLSLRRSLTTNSKSKRSSLLVNMMAKRSMTKLVGPEELVDDASDSASTNTSPARVSLRSLHILSMSRSNDSSPRVAGKSLTPDRQSRDRDSISTRGSSPIPIPRVSPPPTIDFHIESGDLSPSRLFGPEFGGSSPEKPASLSPRSVAVTGTPGGSESITDTIIARDSMIISRHRSKRQAIKNEIERIKEEHIHIPRRSSNDHWRMRKVSRNRPSKLPDTTTTADISRDLPSPMPGTNLPLDDPFDTHAAQLTVSVQLPTSSKVPTITAGHDGTYDTILVSPSTHASTRSAISSRSGSSSKHSQVDVDSMSPQALREEIEASRRALHMLEGRMAGIEAELRGSTLLQPLQAPQRTSDPKIVPSAASQGRSVATSPVINASSRGSSGKHSATSMQHHGLASPDIESTTISDNLSELCQSPLEVQELFYPSDDESATSEAEGHIKELQTLAANGSPEPDVSNDASPTTQFANHDPVIVPDSSSVQILPFNTPSMGSPEVFLNQRAQREQRYQDIFAMQHEQVFGVDKPAMGTVQMDDIDSMYSRRSLNSTSSNNNNAGSNDAEITSDRFAESSPADSAMFNLDQLPPLPGSPAQLPTMEVPTSQQQELALDVMKLLDQPSAMPEHESHDYNMDRPTMDLDTRSPLGTPPLRTRLYRRVKAKEPVMVYRDPVTRPQKQADGEEEWEDVSDKENSEPPCQ